MEVDAFYPVFFPPFQSHLDSATERAANVHNKRFISKNILQLSYFSFSPT